MPMPRTKYFKYFVVGWGVGIGEILVPSSRVSDAFEPMPKSLT